MLSTEQIEQKASRIIDGLMDLSVLDAITVLSNALQQALKRASEKKEPELQRPLITINPYLIQLPIRSKIDADPELKNFIDSLGERLTCVAIAALIRKKFGKKRSVGKSTIGRYKQRMRKLNELNKKGQANG